MPLDVGLRAFLCSLLIAAAAGCATHPPLQRSKEIPISLASEPVRVVIQGTYPKIKLPPEGTYDAETLKGKNGPAWYYQCGGSLAAIICVPFVVVDVAAHVGFVAGEVAYRASHEVLREDPKSNAEKSEHLGQVLSDSVLKRLDETLADSFKGKVGWTQPTLNVAWPPPDSSEHAVNLPSIELGIDKIYLLEPITGTQRLVVCATAYAYPTYRNKPTKNFYRGCRYENLVGNAMYSKGGDATALIERLTNTTKKVGEDMAEVIIIRGW